MIRFGRYYLLLTNIILCSALNLEYLDPSKLQTLTSAKVQWDSATNIISKYLQNVDIEINPLLFKNKKDVFGLRTNNGILQIKASSGVAALWGFHHFLKKYCKSHKGWQQSNIHIPSPLPDVDEVVEANDRFRYYQNVCTASYSFAWWTTNDWINHIEWMAFNGINLALAPVAQESAWVRIYKRLGLTDDEINDHFTGPAFLAWNRMGNVRGWGGPLPESWLKKQKQIQEQVTEYMMNLGMVPVLPAFNGHVPKAFSRLYPNTTFYQVGKWNKFSEDYCCGLFLNPQDPLFKKIGKMFLNELTGATTTGHIYTVDPFNEVMITPWSTDLVKQTAKSIYETISEIDNSAVWLLQNWMFVHDPLMWPKDRVKTFITTVPNGRMLILDLQSEQWPQYFLYDMYFDQPFIWCMLHNFGGTLGMFGDMKTINEDVYEVRKLTNTTMIGIGLTPEGINQNYVVYDLMLESAWRHEPVANLETWVEEYAERRYGCKSTGTAWRHLLKSVYNFRGLNKVRGKYVITRRPSLKIKPWAWYHSHDLFEAWKFMLIAAPGCSSSNAFQYDLVDVTRQALQYRAEQIYVTLTDDYWSNIWVFNATMSRFLSIMEDLTAITGTNEDFTIRNWLNKAKHWATNDYETSIYELNARNQITLWGPNGEISDYAGKQWSEVFQYYYEPRWRKFLEAALSAKINHEMFNEKLTQKFITSTVEQAFATVNIDSTSLHYYDNPVSLAQELYAKWGIAPGMEDLPITVIPRDNTKITPPPDSSDDNEISPSVTMVTSSTFN